jgi:hypothetical protein
LDDDTPAVIRAEGGKSGVMAWEYKIHKLHIGAGDAVGFAESSLNELGENGWEAVAWFNTQTGRIDAHGNDTLVLLKREKSK